jgi:hypothetical protein
MMLGVLFLSIFFSHGIGCIILITFCSFPAEVVKALGF